MWGKKYISNVPGCIFFINILTDIDDKKETPYLINQLERDIDEETYFRYYLVWTSTFDSLVSCPQCLFSPHCAYIMPIDFDQTLVIILLV